MTTSRLLLDTHVFLWWQLDDPRLNATARDAIANAKQVFVSAASTWEAAIKAGLGKLSLPQTIMAGVAASGFDELPICFAHAEGVAALPLYDRDPFDRLLVSQAQLEGLTLVTHNAALRPYTVDILWT